VEGAIEPEERTVTTEAQNVVDAYHRAWTTRDFDRAVSLLSPSLHVEVPINSYPTRESFAEALVRFGSQVASVEVLSEIDAGDEAMILYDMEVEGLGTMRIVEHFTVSDGKIVRLRQIHDTAAIRAAASPPSDAAGYWAEISLGAPRQRVFDALTTLEGLAGWWASTARGSGSVGGQFELGFAGLDEKITMRVDAALISGSVAWTCLGHTGLPDWDGTKIIFTLADHDGDTTELSFRHVGLVPALECYDQCRAGWEQFLSSLRSYAEQGQGSPFQ
jgi:uncharacterized protein YndB with AHSA1/START domain/ketosteroid isomerase-like protein